MSVEGFEPPLFGLKARCISQTILYALSNGGRIRTDDLKVMSLVYFQTILLRYLGDGKCHPTNLSTSITFLFLWIFMEIHKLQNSSIQAWTGITGSKDPRVCPLHYGAIKWEYPDSNQNFRLPKPVGCQVTSIPSKSPWRESNSHLRVYSPT